MEENKCDTCQDHNEVMAHHMQDILKALEDLKKLEKENTAFRLRVQGGLSVVTWTGLVSIALYLYDKMLK